MNTTQKIDSAKRKFESHSKKDKGHVKDRVTFTFQPTKAALKLLSFADTIGMNRSETINKLIEKHFGEELKRHVSKIDETIRGIRGNA